MADRTPVALTIAGSDSGGGAGIQADLKAFAALGRARRVRDHRDHRPEHGRRRGGPSGAAGDPARTDRGGALRTSASTRSRSGCSATRETTLAVAAALDELGREVPVVVDPVMVAESGARLLAAEAHDALVRELLPRASVLTPNVPEARALLGEEPLPGAEEAEAERLARAVLALGPSAVVLTGGHRDSATDLLVCRATGAAPSRSRVRATPTARRTARAAPTRRRWPPRSRSARRSSRRRAARAPSRAKRSPGGCASSARAPARSTRSTSPRGAAR